jgi:transketolase
MPPKPDLDLLCIDTIRTLSMDAVQQAPSGHPGTPMAMAPVVYTLWQQRPASSHRHLRRPERLARCFPQAGG